MFHATQTLPECVASTLILSWLLSLWAKERPTLFEMAPIPLELSTCPSCQAWAGQAHTDPHVQVQEPETRSQGCIWGCLDHRHE